MKRLALAALTLVAVAAPAAPVGETAARTAARNFLSSDDVGARLLFGHALDALERRGALWVARLKPAGYIVLSGDDAAEPVVAFSRTAYAEPPNDSPFAALLATADTNVLAAVAADDKKATDILVIDLIGTTDVCDYFVICTGANNRQVDSIVDEVREKIFQNCGVRPFSCEGREGLNWIKTEMAEVTNLEHKAGSIADMLVGADVFIGVSAPNTVTTEMVKTMNKDAIIFACANPTPEIFPEDAKAGGARIVSTGRSDYPNQINNVLAFPGIFRGAFDVRASDINEEMKVAAAEALAGLVGDELSEDYIIPAAFDPRVGPAVAKAVAEAARRSGVARM